MSEAEGVSNVIVYVLPTSQTSPPFGDVTLAVAKDDEVVIFYSSVVTAGKEVLATGLALVVAG